MTNSINVTFYLTYTEGSFPGELRDGERFTEVFTEQSLRDADGRLAALQTEHGFEHGWWDAGYTESGSQQKYAATDLPKYFEVLVGSQKAPAFVNQLQGFQWNGSKAVLPGVYTLEFFTNESRELKTVHSYCFDRSGESNSLAAFSLAQLREVMRFHFGNDGAYRDLCASAFENQS